MYNVCTMYTTAVGVILPRQLACSRTLVRTSVLFAALTRHTLRLWALTRPSAQPTVPCHGKMAFCVCAVIS